MIIAFHRSRECFGILAFICSITGVLIIPAHGIPAIPAHSFVESIGINTHWSYPNVYTHNFTGLKEKLAESIRYVRNRASKDNYRQIMKLYNTFGIKTNMLTGRRSLGPWPTPLDPTQIDQELNEIKTEVLPATIALESPNEYDLEHGSETDWVGNIKNYSYLIYNKARADPLLRNLPVIGPSLTSIAAYKAVGDADHYIDYVNLHMYQSNRWPGTDGWYNNGTGSIDWYFNYLARSQSPLGKAIQATEAGYHNDISRRGISQQADGKYTDRVFAEFFRRGVYRTYKYELVDEGQPTNEGVFGLLNNDLTEKPSFRAVKNLITILNDKGPNFQPGTLNYVPNGTMDNLRQILFQKRNGDFYLMLWVEVPSWNFTTKIDLSPPPQQVILTFQDTKRICNGTLYALNNNGDVNTSNLSINNSQVTFNVTDKISIVKLSIGTTTIAPGVYQLVSKSGSFSCDLWIIEPMDDGFYRMIDSANDRLVMNVENEKWTSEYLPDGSYCITSSYAQDRCFDQHRCSSNDRVEIEQSARSTIACEEWKLSREKHER